MKNIKLIIYSGDLDIILEKVRRHDFNDVEREIINGKYATRIADEIFFSTGRRYLVYDISKCGKRQEYFAYALRKTRAEIILFSSLPLTPSNFKKDLRETLSLVPTYFVNENSIELETELKFG